MKKQMFYLAAICLVMASCADTADVRDAKGGYRFKTTGKVTLQMPDESNPKATVSQVVNLTNETGSFELVSLKDNDKVLLTFDQLNGDVYHTKGTLSGDELSFDAFTRTLDLPITTEYSDTLHIPYLDLLGQNKFRDSIITYTKTETEVFDITVTGNAKTYENNIIFSLNYKGQSQEDKQRTVEGADIQMLCKKN